MKNKFLATMATMIIVLVILTIFLLIGVTYVHAYDFEPPNKTVHQHIAKEAVKVWTLIPFEIKNHTGNNINATLDKPLNGSYNRGDDIITGSGEEDLAWDTTLNFNANHLWQPDNPNVQNGRAYYDDGYLDAQSSYRRALGFWATKVIPLYLKGEVNESYYWLGRIAHLLEDAGSVPHAHLDAHPPWDDSVLEKYTGNNFLSLKDTYNWNGSNFAGKQYNYEDLPNMTNFDWSTVEATDTLSKQHIELFRLFWYTAQKTQYFASEGAEANEIYKTVNENTYSFNPHLWSGESVTLINKSSWLTQDDITDSGTNVSLQTNATIPHAMRAVAGLYRLFWDAVQIDWPTNRHDNRRTGVTLLKGDMKKASEVDNLNLFLTSAQNQEYVIRSSIADLDNNGYMEAVSVAHEKYDAVIGNLFSVERQRKWEPCPSQIPFCWRNKLKWKTNLNRSVLSPPTAGNIDSTSRKEVLAPRRNSSLLVFDVGSNGESVSQLWEFIVPSKYSAFLNEFNRGELSGSAIEDIDLDGTADVVLTDWLSRGVPDWPAQVYVLGSSGQHKFNATFGNGGAYGSPSVANIDGDDYLEVIIPSFYGVFVFDYNSTNNNFTLRWNNSDGLIDGEVVVYDIDRDNEYELIYSTATEGCSSQKKCFNRTYIRDAKTGANEGPSPISYTNLITRVAPTVANLDSDSNNEIVVIGTNQKSSVSNLGKLVAYDAATGSQEWVYDDGGNLKVAFASPDIADITGDGNLDIIFAENNGSKVYILKKDGTLDFTYTFSAFIDNALAIGDLDSDGKAEIALKRAGSPVAFSTLTGFNEPPELQDIDNITAIAGNLINVNASGQIVASDPDGDVISYTYGAPFNSSGLWQTTVNDTGNYSITVEASDGNLSSIKFVNIFVFNQSTKLVSNFSDGSTKKLLNYTQSGNQTVQIRIPKKAIITYSRLKIGGYSS